MKLTVDTNVFVYMLDSRDPKKQAAAIDLVERARVQECSISLQTVGELYAALTRKMRRAPWEAAQASRNLMTAFTSHRASRTAVDRALAEAMAGRFQYWDALQLASAHEAGCTICFSEDMTNGVALGNVKVVHPFGPRGLSQETLELLE
jgi:predicted nucleic acid-binding protein